MVEQERLHQEERKQEVKSRREQEQGWQKDKQELRGKIGALQETIQGLEGHLKVDSYLLDLLDLLTL